MFKYVIGIFIFIFSGIFTAFTNFETNVEENTSIFDEVLITSDSNGKNKDRREIISDSNFGVLFDNYDLYYKTTLSDGDTIVFDKGLDFCSLKSSSCFSSGSQRKELNRGDGYTDNHNFSFSFENEKFIVFIYGYYFSQYSYKHNMSFISIFDKKNRKFLHYSTRDRFVYNNNHNNSIANISKFVSFEPVYNENKLKLYYTNNNDYYPQYLGQYNTNFKIITIDFDKLDTSYFDYGFYYINYHNSRNSNHDFYSNINYLNNYDKHGFVKVNSLNYQFVESTLPGFSFEYVFKFDKPNEDLSNNLVKIKNVYQNHSSAIFSKNFIVYIENNNLITTYYNNKELVKNGFLTKIENLIISFRFLNLNYNAKTGYIYISFVKDGLFDGNGGFKTIKLKLEDRYRINHGGHGLLGGMKVNEGDVLDGLYHIGSVDGKDVFIDNDVKNFPNFDKNLNVYFNNKIFLGKSSNGDIKFFYYGTNRTIYGNKINENIDLKGDIFSSFFDGLDGVTAPDSSKIDEGSKLLNDLSSIVESIYSFIKPFFDLLFFNSFVNYNTTLDVPFFDVEINNGKPGFNFGIYQAILPDKDNYIIKGVNLMDSDSSSGGKNFITFILGIGYIVGKFLILSLFVLPFTLFYFLVRFIVSTIMMRNGDIQGSDTIVGKGVGAFYHLTIAGIFGTFFVLFYSQILAPINFAISFLNYISYFIVNSFFNWDFFIIFVNGFFSAFYTILVWYFLYFFYKNN